jgi:FKBP-type peptidyl-prolyl cis-trans isomerase
MLRKLLSLFSGNKPMDVPAFSMPSDDALTTTASGLAYAVVSEGSGDAPKATDRVTVHYAGWNTDGSLFDSSYGRGQPATFPLNGVISGWTEGVQLMKPGAVYTFVIPPDLGYGANGAPPAIGPNATLVFQVELLSVA